MLFRVVFLAPRVLVHPICEMINLRMDKIRLGFGVRAARGTKKMTSNDIAADGVDGDRSELDSLEANISIRRNRPIRAFRWWAFVTTCGLLFPVTGSAETRLQKHDGGWQMLHEGKPYFVKGANIWGKNQYLDALVAAGGNSVRTYRPEDTAWFLGRPQTELTILAGLDLGLMRNGFNYGDASAVVAQKNRILDFVRKFRSEGRILAWALGNELELKIDDANQRQLMWRAVEDLAAAIKKEDPSHLTAIVLAGINPVILKEVADVCPSVDLICFNVYGPLPGIRKRLDSLEWKKPYLVTEFGTPGHWEVAKTQWGAEFEFTSTQKAEFGRRAWQDGILGDPKRCLGGYVFFWQAKQEATATWFSLFTLAGKRTAMIDTMAELWKGRVPAQRCPEVTGLEFAEGYNVYPAGATVGVRAQITCVGRSEVLWELGEESSDRKVGGDHEMAPALKKLDRVVEAKGTYNIRLPEKPGSYRLFLTVSDQSGGVATGNLPFRVE